MGGQHCVHSFAVDRLGCLRCINRLHVHVRFQILVPVSPNPRNTDSFRFPLPRAASYDKLKGTEPLGLEDRRNASAESVNRHPETSVRNSTSSSFDRSHPQPYATGMNGSEAEKLATPTTGTTPLKPLDQNGHHQSAV